MGMGMGMVIVPMGMGIAYFIVKKQNSHPYSSFVSTQNVAHLS